MLLYHGPSALDGSPVVAIATGLERKSKNAKTGAMIQVWILAADVSPISAIMTGADVGICGDCPHRGPLGKRSCYVNVGKAPSNVWKKWQKGGYEQCQNLKTFGRGRTIRIGAYGDPAAVPNKIWKTLVSCASGWTGYTHQWRSQTALRSILMASVDTKTEQLTAIARGWRTFRVSPTLVSASTPKEISCPASEEAGKRTTCLSCQLCNGSRGASDPRKSITILAHGTGKKWMMSDARV